MTNRYTSKILGFLFLIAFFAGGLVAQKTVEVTPPKPTPKIKPSPKPKCKDCPETPPPTSEIPEAAPTEPTWSKDKKFEHDDDFPFEASIEVDGEVNMGFCVSQGNIRINGWERDEIRIFINRGGKAGFRPFGKNDDGKPTKLTILGYDPAKDKGREIRQCLSGEEIELDVPHGAYLSALTGREGKITVTVESITKAVIRINQGDIRLREIGEGIVAKTFDGDISVEDSNGSIDLDTTNGGILVYNVEPLEDGDILKARTNSGSLVLQSSTHSVVEATSITGLIKFTGEIQSDGQYTFKNTSGQILLGIPIDSSCTFQVISQKDKFSYDIPLKISNEDVYPPSMKKIIGKIGDGDANINMVNQNGRIIIKKIN